MPSAATGRAAESTYRAGDADAGGAQGHASARSARSALRLRPSAGTVLDDRTALAADRANHLTHRSQPIQPVGLAPCRQPPNPPWSAVMRRAGNNTAEREASCRPRVRFARKESARAEISMVRIAERAGVAKSVMCASSQARTSSSANSLRVRRPRGSRHGLDICNGRCAKSDPPWRPSPTGCWSTRGSTNSPGAGPFRQ